MTRHRSVNSGPIYWQLGIRAGSRAGLFVRGNPQIGWELCGLILAPAVHFVRCSYDGLQCWYSTCSV